LYKEEVIVKILDRAMDELPEIEPHKLRPILDMVLYNYEVTPAVKALVLRSNVKDYATLYMASKKVEGLSAITLKNYGYRLRRFMCFIAKNVEDINAMDIRMYLANYQRHTGCRNTTLESEIAGLKSFFGWLEDEEYIVKSPMRKIKAPKTEKRLREALTPEELELLRDACNTLRERALVEFFYTTGCRLDEVVKVNKPDINWQNLSLNVVGKGNKEREVFISDKAKVHVRKYLLSRMDDCNSLFVTERQPIRKLGRRSIEREFEALGKAAGISKQVSPHVMRHTTATDMLRHGATLSEVQAYLGHEDPSTTQIYAQVSDESVKAAHKRSIQ
jgi:integrase/recombinase XerD